MFTSDVNDFGELIGSVNHDLEMLLMEIKQGHVIMEHLLPNGYMDWAILLNFFG